MFRVVKYATLGSAPVVSFGFMKVEAAEKSSGNKVLVRPKDLPLYSEDKLEWEVRVEERENNALEEGISVVRQQIWKLSDACQVCIRSSYDIGNLDKNLTTPTLIALVPSSLFSILFAPLPPLISTPILISSLPPLSLY